MEMHQRNAGANGKIMKYLSATYRYPGDLGTLIYASQLLQAEAIRYGVEHFRRSRNEDRCMGAVYWQLNDIWPVESWSSVDYFHRWKALMYFAKRFFAPVLLSCEEEGEASEGRTCVTEPGPVKNTARLSVSNETLENVQGTVQWKLRGPLGEVFISGEEEVSVPPLSAVWLPKLDFSSHDRHEVHLSYRMKECGSGGSVLFCPPKHYRFADPCLSVRADSENGTVTVTAAAYAKAVEVYAEDASVRFDDNFFDMEPGTRTIRVAEGRLVPEKLRVRSVYDIR
jgi:beta-mannosidase